MTKYGRILPILVNNIGNELRGQSDWVIIRQPKREIFYMAAAQQYKAICVRRLTRI